MSREQTVLKQCCLSMPNRAAELGWDVRVASATGKGLSAKKIW